MNKILFDNNSWTLSITLFGFGTLEITSPNGEVVYAASLEKRYILGVLSALDKENLDSQERTAVTTNILRGFHGALRGGSYNTGSMVYRVTFAATDAQEEVANYIQAHRRHKHNN